MMMTQGPDEQIERLQAANEQGTGKWQKSEQVLNFYGLDDFAEMEDIFAEYGVPVYHVRNDGTPRFFRRLTAVFKRIFGT